MLSNHPYRYILVVVVALATGMTSCKKSSYLTDGGLANAKTSLTTYDYLKQHPYHYFDTTILIIDHFNLKDSVNNSKTFFAFTDYAVSTLMNTLGVTTLDELYDSLSSKFVTQYLFGQTITLDGANTAGTVYTNWAGASAAPCGVRKLAASEAIYLTSSTLVENYFVLQYIKVNGVLDGSPGAPATDPTDVYLSCQTTGIETSSGTTLHVLANNATLQNL